MDKRKYFLIAYLVIAAMVLAGYGLYIKRMPTRALKLIAARQTENLPGTWETRRQMPVALSEVGVTLLDDKAYVAGGLNAVGQTTASFFAYDFVQDSWEELPPLPEARHHAVAVAAFGLVYVIGGHTGIAFTPTNTVFIFDPATRAWSEGARLEHARGAAAAVFYDGKIYVFGGVGSDGLLAETAVYDPVTNHWESRAPIPTVRDHLAAAVAGGRIVVVGGRKNSLSQNVAATEMYDPAGDQWTQGKNMPDARGGVAAASLADVVYVFGGESPRGTNAEVLGYDISKNEWKPYSSMPAGRHGLGAAAYNGRISLFGGGRIVGLSVSDLNQSFRP